MQHSVDLAKTAEVERALGVLDTALAQATEEDRGKWIKILGRHDAALARFMGEHRREIQSTEQALPYANADAYRFAVYNFAQLLMTDGQAGLGER